jgi:hypothetical protein
MLADMNSSRYTYRAFQDIALYFLYMCNLSVIISLF